MSENKTNWFTPIFNFLWRVALLAFLIYVLKHIQDIIITAIVGGALAYALSFPMDWILKGWNKLMRRLNLVRFPILNKITVSVQFKRILAAVACFVLLFWTMYLAIAIMVSPIRGGLVSLQNQWPAYKTGLDNWKTTKWTPFYHKTIPPELRVEIETYLNSQTGDWAPTFINPLADFVKRSQKLMTSVVESILVPVLAFYFLVDGRRIKRDILQITPKKYMMPLARFFYETNQVMRSYIVCQAILCVIAGIVTYIILVSLGHWVSSSAGDELARYAAMLAIYAGLTRAIPVLGPLIGGIPIVGLAAVSTGSVQLGIIVAIAFTLLHFIESKFIMPLIVGEKLDLHAIWVILSLLVGAQFFGLIGMFFATPLLAIVRNVWRHYFLPREPGKTPGASKPKDPEREPVAV